MIELEGVPELIDPVMICAFEGWNDAGDAASSAVAHLDREWKGEVFAALDAEDYYDFQVNRPTVWLDGGVRKITWPTTRLSVVRTGGGSGGPAGTGEAGDTGGTAGIGGMAGIGGPGGIGGSKGPRDLVLVRGIEPSMRWRSFCNEILGFAHELGVEMVVILGSLLGDTPHTRPVPVSGVTSDPDLARTMDLEESRYEGPTGIVGILQEACTHAGVPTVSLWAAVPHYVSQPPNPKATLALLNRLEDLIDLRIPQGDLPEDARAWQLGVDQLAAEDSEVAEYVQSLEQARDTADLPEASGEAIAREFERYLRRRDGQSGPGAGPGPVGGPGGAGGPGGPGGPGGAVSGPGQPGGLAAEPGFGEAGGRDASYLRDTTSGRTRPPRRAPKEQAEGAEGGDGASGSGPAGSGPAGSGSAGSGPAGSGSAGSGSGSGSGSGPAGSGGEGRTGGERGGGEDENGPPPQGE
ncbi:MULTISPECIES: PAC2 family protein [Streptomyces]|uniref:PAC2 family protein n=1 Tax=Streptomyces TaxID=1883 RepID=UPI00163C1554|nr:MULTISPECIES: PAC2 family protein [Streptomyces]MBC2878215.1 PAC2 family protein [Streptomyces sp. TYQ1024]UBI39711.1 PAC2 family protein [Streptomyces mobaraensis]UKW32291.1 PAC2 family protein [Streptomyces sp. TYQ1024]